MTRSHHPLATLLRRGGASTVLVLLALLWVRPAFAEAPAERVSFGQPMRVEAGERVDTIVTIGGDLTVLGEVDGDAVVIGGSLELGPDAVIHEDAIAVGGTISSPPGATILGDRVEVSGTMARQLGSQQQGSRAGSQDDWRVGTLATSITSFVQVFASFLISLVILAFAPRRVRAVADQMRAHPGWATLFGLGILLLFLPLLGALTISIVGIPLIPVAFMALAAVMVFGMTALALRLGYLMPFYGEHRSAMGAVAIGYIVLAVVALIPWVGAVVVPLAGLFAAGAVLSSWWGRRGAPASVPA